MNNTFNASITGVQLTISQVKKRADETAYGVARGVVLAAHHLLSKAREVVPVDKWVLHNTSRVRVEGRALKKVAVVEFNQPYAARQHEDLTYKHKPGRTAKYLERPARQERATMREIIRREARKGRR